MNKEFESMFERDLILGQNLSDDGRGKIIPIIGSFERRLKFEIKETCESPVENEEKDHADQFEIETHYDDKFEGLDMAIDEESQLNTDKLSGENSNNVIKDQIEYYFSDKNLAKDSFMMKKILLAKNHAFPIKDLLTFPKMKTLIKDVSAINNALSTSKVLVVDNGSITRVKKIPEHILARHSKLGCQVIVSSLSKYYLNDINILKTHLEQCGKIIDIKFYNDKEEVPKSFLELNGKMFTKISSYPFALVEYDTYVDAFRASMELTNTSDWRRGLKVDLFMKLKNPNGKDKENKNIEVKQPKKKNKKSDQTAQKTASQNINIPSSKADPSSFSKSFGASPKKNQPSLVNFMETEERSRSNSFGPLSSSPGRWVQNKMENNKRPVIKKPANFVIREPKGPDGTKGFSLHRTPLTHHQ